MKSLKNYKKKQYFTPTVNLWESVNEPKHLIKYFGLKYYFDGYYLYDVNSHKKIERVPSKRFEINDIFLLESTVVKPDGSKNYCGFNEQVGFLTFSEKQILFI